MTAKIEKNDIIDENVNQELELLVHNIEELRKKLKYLTKELNKNNDSLEFNKLSKLKEKLLKLTLKYINEYSGKNNIEQRNMLSEINLISNIIKLYNANDEFTEKTSLKNKRSEFISKSDVLDIIPSGEIIEAASKFYSEKSFFDFNGNNARLNYIKGANFVRFGMKKNL